MGCNGVLGLLGRRERSELRSAKPHAEHHPVNNLPAGRGVILRSQMLLCDVCPPIPPLRPPCVQIYSALELPGTSRVGVYSPSSGVCLLAAPFVPSHSLPCLRPCRSPPVFPEIPRSHWLLSVVQRTGCSTFGLGHPLRGGLLPCTSLLFRWVLPPRWL
jgi:hypothetical protein